MTKIFLDSANLKEIKELLKWGIVEGITTNQAIFLKEKGCNFEQRSKEILELVAPLPVSLEGPNDFDGILDFAREIEEWRDPDSFENSQLWTPVIKVPMLANGEGLRAVQQLNYLKIDTNITACMSLNQAFLAANANATYVSLFYNRIRDFSDTSFALKLIHDTMVMLNHGDYETKLIIGSIRSPNDLKELMLVNPHIITITPDVLRGMPYHERTVSTLKEFENAWEEFKLEV